MEGWSRVFFFCLFYVLPFNSQKSQIYSVQNCTKSLTNHKIFESRRSLERDLERSRADHLSEMENLLEKHRQQVSETKKKQWVSSSSFLFYSRVHVEQSCNEDSQKILGGLCKGSIIEGEDHLILDPASYFWGKEQAILHGLFQLLSFWVGCLILNPGLVQWMID